VVLIKRLFFLRSSSRPACLLDTNYSMSVVAAEEEAVDEIAASEDIYDFSGLSLNDLSLLQRGLVMATSGGGGGVAARNSYVADDEEWYPPTPPPYDVADKLIEANSRLEADPHSNVRVVDKLKWRSDLVEIR
jgi:hypothetical protein